MAHTAEKGQASILLRLSHAAEEVQTGLRSQEADLRRATEGLGYRVLEPVRLDDGYSGDKREHARPGLRAWLDDARSGRAALLAAWSLDRVTRGGMGALGELLDVMEETGVRFVTVRDGIDSDTASWRIQAAVLSEVARSERDAISARIRRSQAQLRSEGRWRGGPVPYGFQTVSNPAGPGKVLAPVPEEAAALRAALRMLQGGATFARVARYLTAHHGGPRWGAEWSRTSVRNVLTSEAAFAALWTPEERKAVREVTAPRRQQRHPDPSARASRLLSGLLHCHSCGERLYVGRSGDLLTYRCTTTSVGARDCAAPVVIAAERLEAAVAEEWRRGWGALPETEIVYETAGGDALAALEESIAAAETEVLRQRGAARMEALGRLERLEAERDDLASRPVSRVGRVRETGRSLAASWDDGTTEDRREILAATVGRMTIAPGKRGGRPAPPLSRVSDLGRFDPARE